MLVNRTPPSERQQEYGLPVNKRFRRKSLKVQLQIALDSAAKLVNAKPDESLVSRMKLAQVRIASLTALMNKQRKGKLEKALATIERLTAENLKLKQELAAALARPAVRPPDAVQVALAQYESKTNGGAQ